MTDPTPIEADPWAEATYITPDPAYRMRDLVPRMVFTLAEITREVPNPNWTIELRISRKTSAWVHDLGDLALVASMCNIPITIALEQPYSNLHDWDLLISTPQPNPTRVATSGNTKDGNR